MTYAPYGKIEAIDYNTIINNPSGTSFNSVWSTGNANVGYGQTALSNVAIDNAVGASNWAELYNNISKAANHSNTAVPSTYTLPTSGKIIYFENALGTPSVPGSVIDNLVTNSGNARVLTRTSISPRSVTKTNWSNLATFTFTASWANGDAARYFFNAGGTIWFNFSHNTVTGQLATGVNGAMATLAVNCGSVIINQINSPTRQIETTLFSGVTKNGGGGPTPTINNLGYFNLPTSNVQLFNQVLGNTSIANAGYESSSISLIGKTNGTVGTNNDNGNVLTFYALWNVEPDTLVNGTSNTRIRIFYPDATYLTNSWGTVTTTGSSS